MYNFFLIQKYFEQSDSWPFLIRRENIHKLPPDEIILIYEGFEGDLISSALIAENRQKLEEMIENLKKNNDLSNLFFLCNISSNESIPSLIKDDFILIGYEYGTCEEEYTIYSSIFNEILFGRNNELVRYKSILNDYYLFPNESVAEDYANLHHQLLLKGKDVEDDQDMSIYSIWKAKSKLDFTEKVDETKVMHDKQGSLRRFIKHVPE